MIAAVVTEISWGAMWLVDLMRWDSDGMDIGAGGLRRPPSPPPSGRRPRLPRGLAGVGHGTLDRRDALGRQRTGRRRGLGRSRGPWLSRRRRPWWACSTFSWSWSSDSRGGPEGLKFRRAVGDWSSGCLS